MSKSPLRGTLEVLRDTLKQFYTYMHKTSINKYYASLWKVFLPKKITRKAYREKEEFYKLRPYFFNYTTIFEL